MKITNFATEPHQVTSNNVAILLRYSDYPSHLIYSVIIDLTLWLV